MAITAALAIGGCSMFFYDLSREGERGIDFVSSSLFLVNLCVLLYLVDPQTRELFNAWLKPKPGFLGFAVAIAVALVVGCIIGWADVLIQGLFLLR